MPQISLRFVGLGLRASGSHLERMDVPAGTTVADVWERVRASAGEHDHLARLDEERVSVLLNGKLIHYPEREQTELEERDKLTLMVLATGG
jgi:sulfur carrier protein ThiS